MILTQHNTFVRLPAGAIPDAALVAFASDRDAGFGLLRGQIQRIWALVKRAFIGWEGGNCVLSALNTTLETLSFQEEMRKAEKTINRDKGDRGDEKQVQAPFLPLSSPSALLTNLFPVFVRLKKANEQADAPAKQAGRGF